MVERKNISDIFGIAVSIRRPIDGRKGEENARHGDVVLVRKDNGQVLAIVEAESLFDRHGNFFYEDE